MKSLLPAYRRAVCKSLSFLIPLLCAGSLGFAQVKAAFATDTAQGCMPLTIHCTSVLNDNVTAWQWTTGDGQISTEQNPVFTFTKPGKFRIKLKTSNYSVADSATKDITVYGIPALFTYQYNSLCTTPVAVQFKVSYNNSLGNYHWDFGDSSVSIEANPAHTYQTSDNYRIYLVTYSPEGCVDSSVSVLQTGKVSTDFNLPQSVCTNTAVAFASSSQTVPKSASWEIDGKVVSGSTTGFTYHFAQPGTYTVKLTETFGSCSSSQTKQITVLRRPAAAFTEAGTLQSCVYPAPVQFTNASQDADSYHWDFGDGSAATEQNPLHSYSLPGRFSPVLIAAAANGCADTVRKPNLIFIGPPIISGLQNLPRYRCLPDTLKTGALMATPEPVTSYDWDFGNGNHSSDEMPSFIYTKPGQYDISLVVKTGSGCADTFLMKRAVTAGDSIMPSFTVDKTAACASDSFHFKGASSAPVSGWLWYFGDNTTSNQQNPVHRYLSSGQKTVTLQLTNSGCAVRNTQTDLIAIQPPVANIGVIYDCTNQLNVVFKDSSDGAQNWRWNFGDGTPEMTIQHPQLHTYKESGIYTVTLQTRNGQCASADTTIVAVLNTRPVFTFEPAGGYLCRKAKMIMGATNPDYISDYYWNFDNGKSGFSTTSISTYYDKAGTYHPSLVTKYKNGCKDTLYSPQPVHVTGPTAAFNTGSGASCVNDAVTFADKSLTDGVHAITQWQWDCGDTYTETRTTPDFSHNYASYGSYTASLMITDNNNCTDTAYYTLKVSKPPTISAGKDTFVCDGKNTVLLTASGGVSYVWNADAALSCTDCATPVASAVQPSSYIVTGTDANGCTNTDTVQVDVVKPFNLSVVPSVEECQAQSAQLSVSGTDLYSWQPPDGLSDASSATPSASPNETTTYTVTGTDSHHCFSQKSDVLVIVHPKPRFSIDSSLFIVQKGDINLLQTTGSDDIATWNWQPALGLSCTDCPQPYLTAVKTQIYTAIATTEYGCSDTDKVSIQVLCEQNKIYIPNAFTPNNDGKNDWFYVMSSIDNPIASFVIYNRNGGRLFAKTNLISNTPSQGWNGTFNGQPVAQDTYIYRIEMRCNNEVVPFTGTVTVIR